MIFKLWEAILEYFKGKHYWAKIQPIFALLSLYLVTQVLAYQFIQKQYRISPSLQLYVNSYIFKQITLVFATIGIISILFSLLEKRKKTDEPNRFRQFVNKHGRTILSKIAVTCIVLALAVPLFLYYNPNKVSHIRIKFLQEPDFEKYAFVYLIYELNKIQQNWYFEIDFDTFDDSELTAAERERYAGSNKSLGYARLLAGKQAFIGITTEKPGEDFFWQNDHNVSVISTFGWQQYAPPGIYEFLMHSVIVQSILIHLNNHCQGPPDKAFKESRIAYGDLFQFSPRRQAMKAMILATHLSRNGEELLFNCFGAEYLSTCTQLLTKEWLYSKKITENLEKCFGVQLN